MSTYYSDHYGPAVGATGHFTTRSAPGAPRLHPGVKHGRLRKSVARVTIPAGSNLADDDVFRFMDFRSGDRIFDIRLSQDANAGATTAMNFGLYKKGLADDGAVIDEDLFASAVNLAAGIARVDIFKEATTLTDMDRGQPLWYLADKGAGTYTEDPFEVWTLVAQFSSNPDAVDGAVEMMLEVDYLAGD